jgi:hypothetical protein
LTTMVIFFWTRLLLPVLASNDPSPLTRQPELPKSQAA